MLVDGLYTVKSAVWGLSKWKEVININWETKGPQKRGLKEEYEETRFRHVKLMCLSGMNIFSGELYKQKLHVLELV